MRILILSQYFWPESFQINDIATALAARATMSRFSLVSQTTRPDASFPVTGYGLPAQKRTARRPSPCIAFRCWRAAGGLRLALNYLSFIVSGLLLAPWMLRGKQFDVIFVYAPSPILQAIPAILLGWLKRCPTVLWVQDLWPESLSATGYVKSACWARSNVSCASFTDT
ncbi:hypothetical protein LP420_29010 [Massilia sp. B-10]|nr:hypothetical protein LP420_29010 [Massilia sp. B-10]